ncbi:MAG: hypothetical protein WB660_07615 [Candidatus Sulfotelmatobacter sp.]
MTRPLRILPILLVLISLDAFANNINFTNLNANFSMTPNFGDGDNVAGSIFGPGINLSFAAGSNWFFETGFAPGAVGLGGGTAIFVDIASGTIGSRFYGDDEISVGSADFIIGSFTFPPNRKNFTIIVPASIGLLHGANIEGNTFTLATDPGRLTLSFDSSGGLYYPDSGSFTTIPESGTFGLTAIGVGTAACFNYKRKCGRATS